VLSRLLYCRILYPSSKLCAYRQAARFLEAPGFDLQHIYRALDVIAEEADFIQSELYKNSLKAYGRNTEVLYYDCTNYFFEIEQEDGLKQYGYSKEHRPNPIVQMGLFMDGDGTPLAFGIQKGNTNEQVTLRPLEEKILSDFGLSKFIVCTDAGLSSMANRKFNDIGNRAFVTTQSVKQLKTFLQEWALDPKGWLLPGSSEKHDISMFDEKDEAKHYDDVFFKERWINENGLEQRLVVTYSMKYRNYQRTIREEQVARAQKMIGDGSPRLKKNSPNDFKRFIEKTPVTKDGEVAETTLYGIDNNLIEKEQSYDGFYAVCTNIEDKPAGIIQINRRRWKIEECFRLMKHEFKARPVYHQKDNRIEAHFMTCFMALVIYRILERTVGNLDDATCGKLLGCLRGMNFMSIKGEGYIPTYKRTDLTDRLHDAFGFRTDYEIVSMADMKKIFQATKKQQT
jgi:transposase